MVRASKKSSIGFLHWLRTGRLPPVRTADGIELKFNPWHDPADGRFTFAGTGSTQGSGGERMPQPRLRRGARGGSSNGAGGPRTGDHTKVAPKAKAGNAKSSHPIGEFVAGTREGLYDAGRDAVTGTYSLLTTNPVTTIKDINSGVAGMIDDALAAEDTPARIQVQRAASAVAHMYPHDLGHTAGSTIGNAALTVAPGAALNKA